MGKIISFGIQKGGCGKSTTTGMISALLSRRGYKVLAVDFDSQGNLTQLLTKRNKYDFRHKTSLEACQEGDPRPYIHQITDTLHVLPAEDFLSKFSQWLFTDYVEILRQKRNKDEYALSKVLKQTLEVVKDDYDFILVDLPPNLGEHTLNGMGASDYAIVMLQTEPFCMEAVDNYLETLEGSINKVNGNTKLLGILTSMTSVNINISKFMLDKAYQDYEELVFTTTIKRKSRITEYSLEGISDDKKKEDRDAQEMYNEVIEEILKRIG